LAAARIAETEVWKGDGDRSPAHQLARRTGTSVGQAMHAIETGRRLRDLSATSAAARRGELSVQQAEVIADAASAGPDAETRLLDRAQTASLAELRDDCARAKANVADVEARRRSIHERRSLRSWVDRDGAGHVHLTDNPERVAAIMSRVEVQRNDLFEAARAEHRREPLEAYAADALCAIVCGADDPAPRANRGAAAGVKMLVRVDLDALLRGSPRGEETCEIAGFGPVTVSASRSSICSTGCAAITIA
jgi:Domain of unknown function (DUF222)